MVETREYLEDRLSKCGEREGADFSDRVQTLRLDVRTRTRKVGAEEKTMRKKSIQRFAIIKKNKAFRKD